MRHDTTSQVQGEGWSVRTEGPDAGSAARWSGLYDETRQTADVRLTLPARPENVALVRHVLGALAESLGLPEHVRADLKLAVTEACTNVVRHAYDDGDGPIEVVVRPSADGDHLEVIVGDRGRGIAGLSPDAQGPGLGLSLISALVDKLEVHQDDGEGSRLAMWFSRSRPLAEAA